MSAILMARRLKMRAGVFAVSAGIIICVGTLTGAFIKEDKQKRDNAKKFIATPAAEKIAILEEHRTQLLREKADLQRKLDRFHQRVRDREAEKARADAEWRKRRDDWRKRDQERRRIEAERERDDEA